MKSLPTPPCVIHLIRHGVVDPTARGIHYGTMDVALCDATVTAQHEHYAALARRLPHPADWFVTPLRRTAETARALFAAGYPPMKLHLEPEFIEQDIGDWHGLAHDALPPLLTRPAHPFWPMAPEEVPPRGESMAHVLRRVGAALDRIAADHAGRDVVIISHGGAIRAAIAHALNLSATDALRLEIDNLSLTQLERHGPGWRVRRMNESATFAREATP